MIKRRSLVGPVLLRVGLPVLGLALLAFALPAGAQTGYMTANFDVSNASATQRTIPLEVTVTNTDTGTEDMTGITFSGTLPQGLEVPNSGSSTDLALAVWTPVTPGGVTVAEGSKTFTTTLNFTEDLVGVQVTVQATLDQGTVVAGTLSATSGSLSLSLQQEVVEKKSGCALQADNGIPLGLLLLVVALLISIARVRLLPGDHRKRAISDCFTDT